MWQFFKDYHFYRPAEKRAIVVLLTLIVLTIGATFWYERTHQSVLSPEEAAALQVFADSQQQQAGDRRTDISTETAAQQRLEPFDPNTADTLTLVQLGLRPFVVNNVLRYRAKGGVFRQASDFRKIYGLTDEEFTVLAPYIVIRPTSDVSSAQRQGLMMQDAADSLSKAYDKSRQTREMTEGSHRDSVPSLLKEATYEKIEKYEPGTLVDLNKADTTELKKIPGIGSAIARMIVTYRAQLGGFYEVGQLREINLDADPLLSWFAIDEADIRKLSVNSLSADRLRRHPYINFYQAKALVEHRRKHGALTSLQPFVLYEEFTASDLDRLSHYLSFD